MIKRIICLMVALPMIVSGIRASDFLNKFSIRISPGGMLALGGNYNDTEKLSAVVNIGVGLNAALRYEISENIFIDVGYKFTWMSIKGDKKPFAYKEKSPAFNMQMFTLNGTFFLKSGYTVEPYFTLGCGICPWRFSEDSLWGEAWPAPGKPDESFSKTSLGLDIGLGVESYLFSIFSAFVEIKYYYIFSRDVEKFGTDDFNEQDFLGINIGIIFSFGKK
jgi:opacity protein-like surface antigen